MRLVSLAPAVTEILYELGVGRDIVGVTRFCDFPEQAKRKEVIGGFLDVDFSKVKELSPDVIFTSTFLQDEIARKLGANVVHTDPKNLHGVYDSIVKIGRAVNKERNAEEIVSRMKSEFNKLQARAPGNARIYVEEWHRPPTVSGNWVPAVVKAVGGRGMVKEGIISHEVNYEQVRRFNPKIVLLSWCGFGNSNSVLELYENRGWKLGAEVHVIDDSLLNRPGPRLVEGAKEIFRIISTF